MSHRNKQKDHALQQANKVPSTGPKKSGCPPLGMLGRMVYHSIMYGKPSFTWVVLDRAVSSTCCRLYVDSAFT